MNKEAFKDLFSFGLEFSGLSIKEAAKIFKTAPGTITRWMNGHSAPPVNVRIEIIDRLFYSE